MDSPIVGGLLAFLGGCAVAWLNYRVNLRTLRKKPEALASMSVVRQLLNVAYLAAVFLLRKVLPWDAAELLIGAAAGLTLPSILLALRLAKQNDRENQASAPDAPKGGEPDE